MNNLTKSPSFSAETNIFYPIIGEIFHKPSFQTYMYLYLTLGFQHIKHNYTDFEFINNNLENPISDSNAKMHIFDL